MCADPFANLSCCWADKWKIAIWDESPSIVYKKTCLLFQPSCVTSRLVWSAAEVQGHWTLWWLPPARWAEVKTPVNSTSASTHSKTLAMQVSALRQLKNHVVPLILITVFLLFIASFGVLPIEGPHLSPKWVPESNCSFYWGRTTVLLYFIVHIMWSCVT